MKSNLSILRVLFIFLLATIFIACELEKEEEINEIEHQTLGVDKDISRPGTQGDK